MVVVNSDLFIDQYKNILDSLSKIDLEDTKKFKAHLDTVLLNIASKYSKYKTSIYFQDENIKDIEHRGFTITVYYDENIDVFVILGIIRKN